MPCSITIFNLYKKSQTVRFGKAHIYLKTTIDCLRVEFNVYCKIEPGRCSVDRD